MGVEVAADVADRDEVGELAPARRLQLAAALAQLRLDVVVAEALVDLLLGRDIHRLDVGLVDPLDAAVGPANPDRRRQGVEQCTAETDVAGELPMLIDDAGEVAPVAGDIAQPQNGASPRDAALGLDMASSRGPEQHAERAALGEQGIEPGFQLVRPRSLEPHAEAQQLLCIFGQSRHGGERVRDDAHAFSMLPVDEDLRLCPQHRLCRGEVASQLRDLLAPAASHTAGQAARAPEPQPGDRDRSGRQSNGEHMNQPNGTDFTELLAGDGQGQKNGTRQARRQEQCQLPARPNVPGEDRGNPHYAERTPQRLRRVLAYKARIAANSAKTLFRVCID